MTKSIDPRLIQKIQAAGDSGQVEALVTLSGVPPAPESGEPGGRGRSLVDRVTSMTGEPPTRTKFLPRLGVLYVRGSGRLLRLLLEQEEVSSASATDYEAETPGRS